jgi:MreB/Mbl protein
MLDFLKPASVYIKIFYNKVEITNLKTGETISRQALEPFSNKRLVVADFNVAELLIRSIVKELQLTKSFIGRSLRIIIQQMENLEDGLSETEKRVLRDLSEQAGGAFVIIVEHTRPLSSNEAISELEAR